MENRRGGRVVQPRALYLDEINDSQELAWRKAIEAIEERAPRASALALFPEDRCEVLIDGGSIVRPKLQGEMAVPAGDIRLVGPDAVPGVLSVARA